MTPTCAARSLALEEDIWGTAPEEPGFLVLENPGPWGRDAMADSRLQSIGAEINKRAKATGLRVQAARRSTRRYRTQGTVAWIGRFGAGMVRLDLESAADLLDLDFAAPGGVEDPEPLYLVCTHSTRDPCCARHGLPLAREIRQAAPGRTWHTSHLGGHRFAATMAILPAGWWLGRVPASWGADIVAGTIPPDLLRGRAGIPAAAQVAEIHVRRSHSLRGSQDASVVAVEGDRITVRAGAEDVVVTVRHEATGIERPLSCGQGAKVEDPGRFVVT